MSGSKNVIAAALRDRYELLEELGSGGFGTVHKARQLATSQPVAIKVLRIPEDASPATLEKRIIRFQREMQMCAQMHHPNIVRLIDSGRAEGMGVYTIFEFVPGKNLGQVIQEEGRLDPAEARHLMAQLLDALSCAHSQGVVHRDIKPANLMVVPTGARRNVLVLDFGISSLVEDHLHGEHPRLTLTNESIGTPCYAAPEQLRGQPPTPRSDLYTWGLVFLECLTGKRVIDGATVAEAMFKQLSPEPIAIPPMLASHPLGRLLQRVTAKDPEARDVTAKELLHELEAIDVSGLRSMVTSSQERPVTPDAITSTIEGDATPSPQISGSRLVEGERRQLTALCCKLTATNLGSKSIEFEELEQMLGVHQETCSKIARRLGAHVAGTMGDTVLFYFGYPAAHEDDAQRAAQTALKIMAELRSRSDALSTGRQVRIEARIGIHTGLVVAREQRDPSAPQLGYVMGATPRLAEQLCSQAEPGRPVVSSETWKLLRGHYALEDGGSRSFDDTSAPLDVFLLSDGAPDALPGMTPLIGRQQELGALMERWEKVRAGAGQAVLLSGEAGIGKSRLAREVAEWVRAGGATWMECRCMPDGVKTPFFAIIDLLNRLVDTGRESTVESKLARLEALLARVQFDLAEAMPLFTALLSLPLPSRWSPLDVSAHKQREMTRDAVLALLFEMAEQAPVGLLVEDMHWADPSTRELLNQLVSELSSSRVYALFSGRPEFKPTWSVSNVQTVQLGRLGRPEVERIAARLTGERPLPPEVLQQITERTDGVPLFVEELLRSMIESGTLVEREGRYELVQELSAVNIPSTLRDSLAARLDRLGTSKETAQVAAVIGREFTPELLKAVRALDDKTLQEDLDKLVGAELVHRKRRLKGAVYLFKHALVRDAAYDSMLKRSRQQVHARVAHSIVEGMPDVARERPELVAFHLAAAEFKREAIGYAQKATLAAMQRSANAEALAHAREALGWVADLEDERERKEQELALNGLIIPTLMASAGYGAPELSTLTSRSLELIDSLGESTHIFPTLFAIVMYHHVRSHRAQALELARRLIAMAEQHAERTGDFSQLVGSLPPFAQCLWFDGRYAEAREAAERVLALHDPQKHRHLGYVFGIDPKTWALTQLGNLMWYLGYPDKAKQYVDESVEWAREVNQPNSTALALIYVSMLHHLRREPELARAAADSSIELSERYGLPFNKTFARLVRGYASHDTEDVKQILEDNQAMGQIVAMPYYRSILAEANAARGQVSEALAQVDECLRFAEEHADVYYTSNLHYLRGMQLLKQTSDVSGAEQSFRQAISIAREQGTRLPLLQATVELCKLLKSRGSTPEARTLLQESFSPLTEGFSTPVVLEAKALLTELGA